MSKLKEWMICLFAFLVAICVGLGVFFAMPAQTAHAEDSQTAQTDDDVVLLTKSDGTSTTNEYYTDFNNAVEAIAGDTTNTAFTLKLLQDVTTTSTVTFTQKVTLDLDGYKLTGTTGAVIQVESGGEFTLTDSNTSYGSHLFAMDDDGLYTFNEMLRFGDTIEGGIVTGGNNTSEGAGVIVKAGGTFTLNAGTIAGNKTEANGGGVYVENTGTFIMTGGAIMGNVAQSGAGVNTLGNTTISGGSITDNKASVSSAGVAYSGTFTVSGSAYISQNYVVSNNNEMDSEENIQLQSDPIHVQKMTSGAKIGLIPYNKDDPTQDANPLADFGTNNQGDEPSNYFYSDWMAKDASGNNSKAFKLVYDSTTDTTAWKALTLVEKPSPSPVSKVFDNSTSSVPVASSDYTVIGIDDSVKSAQSYNLFYQLTDKDSTAWSDGTQDDIAFSYVITKRGVTKPTEDETKLVYADGAYTYDTGSDWITAEVSDKTTEGGIHTVTLSLAYPNDTYWGTEDTDDTANIYFTFNLEGTDSTLSGGVGDSDEKNYMWLIVVLSAILVIEVVAVCTYWQNRRERNNRDYFAVAPLSMLLLVMPVYQLALIALLGAAIVLVAIYHVYLLVKNKDTDDELLAEQLAPVQTSAPVKPLQTNAQPVTNNAQPVNNNIVQNTVAPQQQQGNFVPYMPPMAPQQSASPKEEEQPKPQNESSLQEASLQSYMGEPYGTSVSGYTDDTELYNVLPKTSATENPFANNHSSVTQTTTFTQAPMPEAKPAYLDDEEEDTMAIPAGATATDEIAITDEDGEVTEVLKGVDYKTNTAYVVRYKKSFTARLIQSWDESKNYYTNLRNEALRYKQTRSKVSWDYDCISVDLQPIIKFDIRGKTLCLYFALNPAHFKGTKYQVERSEIKKCEDVPCLYRIKDDTCEKYAMELIAKVAELFGLDRGRRKTEEEFYPYEVTSALVKKNLIKEYIAKEKYDEFLRKSNKQQTGKKAKSAQKKVLNFAEDDRLMTASFNDDDIEEVRTVDKVTGQPVVLRYNKSFTAKLTQVSDEMKSYYSMLKNDILSYRTTKSTMGWNSESIHTGNQTIAKFAIHDNILCLYLALRPSDYTDSQYQVETAEGKRYAHVPCMYRIKNMHRAKSAIDLIADLARKYNLELGSHQNENYYLAYKTSDQLISEGLIKELTK